MSGQVGMGGARGKASTLQSVADAAGVHRSTAARALDPRQSHRISAEVAARVREEAARQGYRRDAIAASLRTGRSRLVGVVLPDLSNPVFAPILDGIAEELSRHGYSMLVAEEGASVAGTRTAIVEELIARRVDGLVLATARRRDLVLDVCLEAQVPTILVNRGEDILRVSTTVPDDEAGMRLAVDHLVGLGHSEIAHVAGPETVSTGVLRRHGFENAMRAHALAADRIVASAAYSREEGHRVAAQVLERWPGVTAVAAGNDLLALGFYEALRERGLRCPQDLSITGFNDMPLVDLVEPPLTTIKVAQSLMGATAAGLLLHAIENPDAPARSALTPVELVERRSTASPRTESGKR